ncbi:MAG: DUF1350 domain-containing protein [Phormidium sp. GEM2.Bin31]|nr:MAG: DUF1350 domain-containing protein [Phormidium sp. GEM2.Bin31]
MAQRVPEWQEVTGSSVLIPRPPKGIIHFLGGAFVATAPKYTYRFLLEYLASQGYLVIATPLSNTLNHKEMAQESLNRFEQTCDRLYATGQLRQRGLSVYGVGHSLGCKLHLLISSLFSVKRAGNVFMAYNNYPARRSIPFVDQLSVLTDVEFTPSPQQTEALIANHYGVRRNLLIKFQDDTIDQTLMLRPVLERMFPDWVSFRLLKGTHLTPIAQDIPWDVGQSFSPLDAMAQWVKQGFYRDLNGLTREVGFWLDPTMGRRQ